MGNKECRNPTLVFTQSWSVSQPLAVCEEVTCLQVHHKGKSVPLEVLTCAKKHGLGCSREKWKFTGEWCSRLEIQLWKQEDD